VLCVQSPVDSTIATISQPDTEQPTASSSGLTDGPAAETVVVTTTGTISDADVMSVDSQAQSAAAEASQLPASQTGILLSVVTL